MTSRKEVERVFLESYMYKKKCWPKNQTKFSPILLSLRVLVPKVSTFLYHLRGQKNSIPSLFLVLYYHFFFLLIPCRSRGEFSIMDSKRHSFLVISFSVELYILLGPQKKKNIQVKN